MPARSVNKVIINGSAVIDITDTTATASDVAPGKYFYGADGAKTLGTSTAGVSLEYVTDASGTTAVITGTEGGGNPNENLVKWADGTLTALDLTGAKIISARFRTVSIGANFTVYAPDVTEVVDYAFHQSRNLIGFDGKNVTKIGTQAFYNTRLPLIVLPSFNSMLNRNAFNLNTVLVVADLGQPTSLSPSSFANCTSLTTLILRKSDSITTLQNINAFTSTPFASGGTGGTLYVPSALISDYTNATNWSTILGYENNSITAIEGSIYEFQYADGTDIPWQMMKHNAFDTYTNYKEGNGNDFVVMDNGEWVKVESNGKNANSTSFYNKDRFSYNDIKDKHCRITWEFTVNDSELFSSTGFSNISLGLFSQQTKTTGSIGVDRTAKVDLATSSVTQNYIGKNSITFIPSELFAGLTESNYFGWNIGFRSSSSDLVFNILQFDFEIFE